MSRLSSFPLDDFGRAIRSVLKGTDDASKKKVKDNLNAALKTARKRWVDGDEDGARQILSKIQAGAPKKAAKKAKAAKAKPAAAAPKAAASKTPMLDKIAEGARPMDEVLRGETTPKAAALDAIADRKPTPKSAKKVEDTEFVKPDDKIDESRERALDEMADSGPKRTAAQRLEEAKKRGAEKGGPDEEEFFSEELPDLPDADDDAGWLATLKRAELADPVIRQNIIRNWNRAFNYKSYRGEFSLDEMIKAQKENVSRRSKNLGSMSNKEFNEFMENLRNPKELPKGYTNSDERMLDLTDKPAAEQARRIASQRRASKEMNKDLTSYKFSGKEKAAIKQENRRRRARGQSNMQRADVDAFVAALRNPIGKKTFSSMPKTEKKNLPPGKPRATKPRAAEDVKAENNFIDDLNGERVSDGKKPMSAEAEQKMRQKFRQSRFLGETRSVPTVRKRVKKRQTTAEATKDPTQKITPARRETVREMGRRARSRGQGKNAMQDPSFKKYTAGITPGDRDDLLRDWLDGWNS